MKNKYTAKEKAKFKTYYLKIAKAILNVDYKDVCKQLDVALKAGFPVDFTPEPRGALPYKTLLFLSANIKRPFLHTKDEQEKIEKIALHLISNGANVNLKDERWQNYLLYMCTFAHNWIEPEYFETIVKMTDDVNYAVDRRKPEYRPTAFSKIAETLVELLADPELAASYEKRNIAGKGRYFRLLQILLDAGADPYLADRWTNIEFLQKETLVQCNEEELTSAINQVKHFIETYKEQTKQLSEEAPSVMAFDYEI